jgi:hypothetical protein
MTRTTTIVTLALLSSVLTPVVVKATGTESSAPAQQAKVEVVAVTTPAPAASEPSCARKVKVVYAGYGEAHAATCDTTADLRR